MRKLIAILVIQVTLIGTPGRMSAETGESKEHETSPSAQTNGFLRGKAGDLQFDNGDLEWLAFGGRDAFVIKPKGKVDPERRWVWIAPAWLGIWYDPQNPIKTKVEYDYYFEELLKSGFHVVGLDAGTTLGSPKGADFFESFYQKIVKEYQLNPKARLIGQSNGGLIAYAWAFRHPDQVDRIYGSQPSLDLRSWPKLESVVDPTSAAEEFGFGVITMDELKKKLPEVNPIDNLAPLAKAGVKILHIHGEADPTVPYEPNSVVAMQKYHALGGQMEVVGLPGVAHGPGPKFYNSEKALEFLRGD